MSDEGYAVEVGTVVQVLCYYSTACTYSGDEVDGWDGIWWENGKKTMFIYIKHRRYIFCI
jgi:hypothetical protein